MKMLARAGLLLSAIALPASIAAQTDPYASYVNPSAPSRSFASITPSDSANLTQVPKAIYVGGAGDITIVGVDAAAGAAGVLFKAVPAGSILPVQPRQVKATGTTATNLVALN